MLLSVPEDELVTQFSACGYTIHSQGCFLAYRTTRRQTLSRSVKSRTA